jgi:hypothetical protein
MFVQLENLVLKFTELLIVNISGSQTLGFNGDSDGRFEGDSDGDPMDKTSLELPIFLNHWSASGVASTFFISINIKTNKK